MEDNHDRVIVHIDIDCFYAQVEMIKRPELKEKPMGIQQKNIVVTCNYPARSRGVGKCMYISEAKEKCPELELVNGEDLAEYRRVSAAVHATLSETGCPVERLGMDENWLDVTQMVKLRLRESSEAPDSVRGNVYGEFSCEECECVASLKIGTVIAEELRESLRKKHGLTASAGIAHNKMLSKLVGSKNKPDNQTAIASAGVLELLKADKLVTSIPGIGRKTGEILSGAGILNLQNLRDCPIDLLCEKGIPRNQAEVIRDLAWGKDTSEVKMSGRPASVGLEDRFMGIYNKEECREKLKWLLGRLTQLLAEDGRKPTNIKVTVRDYYKDKLVKKFHKESRQVRISPRLFQLEEGTLKEELQEEIIEICLGLLAKMIDFKDAFHITLMGLAVTDFLEQVEKKSSIKHFFISPKKDGVPMSIPTGEVRRNRLFQDESKSTKRKSDQNTMSEKRSKIETEVRDRNENILHPNSEGGLQKIGSFCDCPKEFDPEVWKNIPVEIKKEILGSKEERGNQEQPELSGDKYAHGNKEQPGHAEYKPEHGNLEQQAHSSKYPSTESESKAVSDSVAQSGDETVGHVDSTLESEDPALLCPPGYDPEVFRQLPVDIRDELLRQSSTGSTKTTSKGTFCRGGKTKGKQSGGKAKSKASNSILNYFSKK